MLLYCETDTGSAREPGPWPRAGTLESLAELNESGLALLAEEARVRGSQGAPLLRQVGELWKALDGGARRRAAACPYLLLDAGFADASRWRPAAQQVGDGPRCTCASYFTVPAALEVGRQVFTFAWHLARSQGLDARLMLGMPAASATLIAQHTLLQIQGLAELHGEWLRPRWAARTEAWRELLIAAASGESAALERFRLHGFALMAAEARRAAPRAAVEDNPRAR